MSQLNLNQTKYLQDIFKNHIKSLLKVLQMLWKRLLCRCHKKKKKKKNQKKKQEGKKKKKLLNLIIIIIIS